MGKIPVELDLDLIRKYEKVKSPYYTTYPTGGEWHKDFSPKDYLAALEETFPKGSKVPLDLYVHIPFCEKLCYFCFCITYITVNRETIQGFTRYLFREIDMLRSFFDRRGIIPDVREIHLGGGTPTYLTREEFDAMIAKLGTLADLSHIEQLALEIDPRSVKPEDMSYFLDKGASRISFGIQDFDPRVMKAVNRVNPPEMIRDLLAVPGVRQHSVSFDLIYGLPYQTRETLRKTLDKVKKLDPDRISLYYYDHTPDILKHQVLMNPKDMPGVDDKILMYHESVQNLLDSGYEWVGIDHFAKSRDKLAQAARKGTLGRNLNGYTTGTHSAIEVGLGPSSIGRLPRYYVQSIKTLKEYNEAIDAGSFPVLRGMRLSNDDLVRREIILKIICSGTVRFAEIEKKYSLDFRSYFARELEALGALAADGLVEVSRGSIAVQPLGRIFVQHIAKTFDKYLQADKPYVRTHQAIKREKNLN